MKNKILFLLMVVTMITACSNNDEIEPFNASSKDLIGTWRLTGLEVTVTSTITFNNITEIISESIEGKNFNATFVFEPTTVKVLGSYTSVTTETEGGITTTSEELTVIENDEPDMWSLQNNIFQIEDENNYEVVEFTPNKFVIKSTSLETTTEDGVTISASVISTITLEK